MRRIARLLAVVCLGALTLVSCATETAPTAGSGSTSGKLLVYTSIYPDIIESLEPVLSAEFPELEVEFFQAGSEKVIAKLAAEIEAGGIRADVLMIADPAYYTTLKDQDLLTKYVSPNAADVPDSIKDEDGFFTAVRISNMIIGYNTASVTAASAPKTWTALAEARWKGAVAMPNPLLSGSTFDSVAALSQALGWKYFDSLRANELRVLEGNSAVEKALGTGEAKVGMVLEENILKAKAAGSPVAVSYPSDGIVSIPSPIAITSGANNPDGAKALVDFMLSDEGQDALVAGWMHSVKPGAIAPKGSALESDSLAEKSLKIDWVALSARIEAVKAEFSKRVLE